MQICQTVNLQPLEAQTAGPEDQTMELRLVTILWHCAGVAVHKSTPDGSRPAGSGMGAMGRRERM